jgi:hypothetical protein
LTHLPFADVLETALAIEASRRGIWRLPLTLLELPLGDQQPRAHPAFDLIPSSPSFHVPAYSFDNREGGFDHIRAAERSPELVQCAQSVNGERFFHSFLQAARSTRI